MTDSGQRKRRHWQSSARESALVLHENPTTFRPSYPSGLSAPASLVAFFSVPPTCCLPILHRGQRVLVGCFLPSSVPFFWAAIPLALPLQPCPVGTSLYCHGFSSWVSQAPRLPIRATSQGRRGANAAAWANGSRARCRTLDLPSFPSSYRHREGVPSPSWGVIGRGMMFVGPCIQPKTFLLRPA